MAKLLLYCVKAKPYLVKRNIFAGVEPSYFVLNENVEDKLNGKIVAECDFEVEEIYLNNNVIMGTKTLNSYDLVAKSKVEIEQMRNYLKGENGYAIHIKNLKIFDEPKELGDYTYFGTKLFGTLGNAPQNMMYAYDNEEKKILISIQPQWLCKILNKEKTIEIRKKVLREMIK